MSVSIKYTLGGRVVSRDQFFQGIEGQIREFAVEKVKGNVERVRCPEHGEVATISEVRETGEGFSFTLSGCCDDLIKRAQSAIS